jgi:hypothetical protein
MPLWTSTRLIELQQVLSSMVLSLVLKSKQKVLNLKSPDIRDVCIAAWATSLSLAHTKTDRAESKWMLPWEAF